MAGIMLKYIGWDIAGNTPLLNKGKPLIRISKNDVWLCSEYEKELISRLIRRDTDVGLDTTTKTPICRRLPSEYGEYATEVWCDGVKYGVMLYSTREGWLFYPTGALASILVKHINKPIIITPKTRRLKGKYIEIPGEHRTRYIVFLAGKYAGICRNRNNKCKVKDIAPNVFKELPPIDPQEIANANRLYLDTLIHEAIAFIKNIAYKYSPPYAVAYSGGIDSTITLYLVAEALGAKNIVAVYSDTGLEFPETRRFAEKIAEKIGVTFEIVHGEKSFIELIEEKKELPTRNNRWCTGELKIKPLYNYYTRHNIRLVFEGIRRYESTTRQHMKRITTSRYMLGIRRALPILNWTRLEAQLLSIYKNIDINPIYNDGFTRIGCMICPAMHLHELHLSYLKNKDIFQEVSIKLGKDLGYILRGLWRKRPINMANYSK